MNRIIIAFVFSLLYLSSTSLKSEIVKDLIIDGNNRISDETIRLYGGIKLQEDLSQKELNTILQNLYDTNFFEDFTSFIICSTLFEKFILFSNLSSPVPIPNLRFFMSSNLFIYSSNKV